MLELGVHSVDCVPGGQGSVMDDVEADTVTEGGWFGGGGKVRALRRPTQSCPMKPCGSCE
jgi:hypothetical protein